MEQPQAMGLPPHQYIDRKSGEVRTEKLFGDKTVNLLYSNFRESAPALYRAATGRWASRFLGALAYDYLLKFRLNSPIEYFMTLGIDHTECLDPLSHFTTPREIFERKIRYWEVRPMNADQETVVCPADSRLLVGSMTETSQLFIKNKFFKFEELLGQGNPLWQHAFAGGDFAVFRLTPDKYHYSHSPVSGRVVDHYEVEGGYHACNPGAVVAEVTPFSKNKRVVTIIDTDIPNGTKVGKVAMVEVVALMIGQVVQRYSSDRYESPRGMIKGMHLSRGAPKSLFRPGSSTDILLFEPGRIRFSKDLLQNQQRKDVASRFSLGFGSSLVETDVAVREPLATGIQPFARPRVV